MEDGFIDHSHWFARKPSERAAKLNRALMRFLARCVVHRVIAHRCPACSRVALTAP